MNLRLLLSLLLGVVVVAASPAIAATRPQTVAQLRKQLVEVTRQRDAATARAAHASAALAEMTSRRDSWRADAGAVNAKLLEALRAYVHEDALVQASSSALTASAQTQVAAMSVAQLWALVIAINGRFLAASDPNYSVTSSVADASSTYQFDFHPTPGWAVR